MNHLFIQRGNNLLEVFPDKYKNPKFHADSTDTGTCQTFPSTSVAKFSRALNRVRIQLVP